MLGKILFAMQVIAIIVCAVPFTLHLPSPLTLLFMMVSLALFLWVLSYNKADNWSVLPAPKINGKLITSGPYHFMRHPMYLSVILCGLSFVIHNQSIQSFIAWLSLTLILNIKARYEERLLNASHPEYQRYQANVKTRFLPSLF